MVQESKRSNSTILDNLPKRHSQIRSAGILRFVLFRRNISDINLNAISTNFIKLQMHRQLRKGNPLARGRNRFQRKYNTQFIPDSEGFCLARNEIVTFKIDCSCSLPTTARERHNCTMHKEKMMPTSW